MLPLTMLMFLLGLCASLPETEDYREIEPSISEVTGEREQAERSINDEILARLAAGGGGGGFNLSTLPNTNTALHALLPFILNRLNITG